MMIEIRNLTHNYNGRSSLDGINFEIKKGEIAGIIGPNGAGKTTLLKCILGLIRYRGEVLLKDVPIKNIPVKHLAKTFAYMPSQNEVSYDYSVHEIISMGRFPYTNMIGEQSPHDVEIIGRFMSAMNLNSFRNRSINSLSSGEKQLVFLCQALVQEPEIIFLDEPTAHLDVAHQIDIFETLCKLNVERGLTVVFVNHDLNLTSYYATKIAVLSEGKLLNYGEPQKVFKEEYLNELYKLNGATKISVKELKGKYFTHLSASHSNYQNQI